MSVIERCLIHTGSSGIGLVHCIVQLECQGIIVELTPECVKRPVLREGSIKTIY